MERDTKIVAIASMLGVLVSAAGVIVAVRLPISQSNAKSVSDLVAARNLAYMAERLSESVLNKVRNGAETDELSSSIYDFESSKKALESISFKEITPSSISPYFVDIWHVTLEAEKLRKGDAAVTSEYVKNLLDRASCNINTIDTYLDELHAPHVRDDHWGKYAVFYYTDQDGEWNSVFWRQIYFAPKPICSRGGAL